MPVESGMYANFKPGDIAGSFSQGLESGQRLSAFQKQQKAFDRDQAMKAREQNMTIVGQALQGMKDLPIEKRASQWPSIRKSLVSQGVPENELLEVYDDNTFNQALKTFENLPSQLALQKTKAEIDNLKRRNNPEFDPYKALLTQNLMEKMEERKFAKTPEGRLKALSGEQKQRLDNAKLGLISTQGMADALQSGDNTFSLVGDNDFTQQRTLFEEALGRMQSGGAITMDEAKRFRNMAPTIYDSAEMQQKKLAQLQNEMQSRLSTLGFTPEEVGIAKRESTPRKNGGMYGGNNANAASLPKNGSVEDGYVFMGGDPSNPKSWKRAK